MLIKPVILAFVVLLVATSTNVLAQEKIPRPETMQCRDGKHSYVVYLPPTYDSSKKWPVLFCFDALGHGELTAMLFYSASVNQEWIVVGSLDV